MSRDNGDSFVCTGIYGLDTIFMGGINRGNIILVTGEIGSGKTLMGIEFIYRGIVEFDESGIIVVFETNPSKLLRDAATLGWDLQTLQDQNRLRIIFTTPQVLEQELRSPDSLLLEIAAQIGARRLYIDGIGQLRPPMMDTGATLAASSYHELLLQVIEGLNRENLTTMFTHESSPSPDMVPTLEVAKHLADTVIHLQRGDYPLDSYRRLEILKSRGQNFEAGVHTLRITSGVGLQVYRRVQASIGSHPPRQPTSSARRSMIGTAALDELTGGGVYEGSTTLVIGASGVGKSILGYQMLSEGARTLGRRSLLVTLDEHPAQILRNADALGLDLSEQVEAGMVQILSDSPLEIEVNVHFDRIVRLCQEHNIERLVLDGLTTYANAIHDPRTYREFLHSLIAFTKSRLITVFLSYESPELFGITRFMADANVSSIMDNIFLLSYVELSNKVHRAITVAKARGCNHQPFTREYQIARGGIVLVPEEHESIAARPFGQYYNLLSRAPTRFSRDNGLLPSET